MGSTRYEVLDNPDMLVEIADWESAEERVAHMQEAASTGVYAPVFEMLAAPYLPEVRNSYGVIDGLAHWI